MVLSRRSQPVLVAHRGAAPPLDDPLDQGGVDAGCIDLSAAHRLAPRDMLGGELAEP